jgi:hypothetical protein
MNHSETLAWLAEFQAGFSDAICAPLDPAGGTLHPDTARYPAATCARVLASPKLTAAERLTVYNRQYWFRLLRTLQQELPLTSRLFGLWSFNQRAIAFLCEHPPRGQDLGSVCIGFDDYLAATLTSEQVPCPERRSQLPRAALLEAAELDLAFRRVFLAPDQPRFQLSPRLGIEQLRLQPSAAYARFTEHWPLLRLRAPLLDRAAPHVVVLPAALPVLQTWALFRTPQGVGQLALESQHARLLELLDAQPMGAALAQLEAETAQQERAGLPERVQRWLVQSVRLGFFRGVERPHR